MYAALWTKSSFSFLEGASHAEEHVEEAHRLGISSIAITDRDGVDGVVRAHVKAREIGMHIIIGAQITVAAPGTVLASSAVSTELGGHGPGWDVPDEAAPALVGRRSRTSAKPRAMPETPRSSIVLLPRPIATAWRSITRLITADRRRWHDKGDSR